MIRMIFSFLLSLSSTRFGKLEILPLKIETFFSGQTNIPELAEAFGVLQGLLLMEEDGWTKVWYESDARNIILQLNDQALQISH